MMLVDFVCPLTQQFAQKKIATMSVPNVWKDTTLTPTIDAKKLTPTAKSSTSTLEFVTSAIKDTKSARTN